MRPARDSGGPMRVWGLRIELFIDGGNWANIRAKPLINASQSKFPSQTTLCCAEYSSVSQMFWFVPRQQSLWILIHILFIILLLSWRIFNYFRLSTFLSVCKCIETLRVRAINLHCFKKLKATNKQRRKKPVQLAWLSGWMLTYEPGGHVPQLGTQSPG